MPEIPGAAEPVVLPAYAGMILQVGDGLPADYGAPRVCGDDPAVISGAGAVIQCSPRMRG